MAASEDKIPGRAWHLLAILMVFYLFSFLVFDDRAMVGYSMLIAIVLSARLAVLAMALSRRAYVAAVIEREAEIAAQPPQAPAGIPRSSTPEAVLAVAPVPRTT